MSGCARSNGSTGRGGMGVRKVVEVGSTCGDGIVWPPMAHPTMTARWSSVVAATWAVPAAVIARYLPVDRTKGQSRNAPGTEGIEPDVYPGAELALGDGRAGAAVSLVARRAAHVRVMGVGVPRMGTFDSLALTIAVRERGSGRRGVVCVREIVSNRGIAWLMRRWYNHPCVTAPLDVEVKQQTQFIGAEYRMAWPVGGLAPGSYVSKQMETEEQMVRVVGRKPAVRGEVKVQSANGKVQSRERVQSARVKVQIEETAGAETLESWLTERPFVFGLDVRGAAIAHEAIHPSWGFYPAVDSSVRVDFASVFGAEFGFLGGMPAQHVMLAVGSEVAMFPSRAGAAGVRWGERRG